MGASGPELLSLLGRNPRKPMAGEALISEPNKVAQAATAERLKQLFDKLWTAAAIGYFAGGQEIDMLLSKKQGCLVVTKKPIPRTRWLSNRIRRLLDGAPSPVENDPNRASISRKEILQGLENTTKTSDEDVPCPLPGGQGEGSNAFVEYQGRTRFDTILALPWQGILGRRSLILLRGQNREGEQPLG